MSNHSVIEHRASYHFVKLEEDYLAICSRGESSPHCKAFILSILEHWMNSKRAKGDGDYAYLTMPEWIRHMYMLYERNVIENSIKELLNEGLIIRRPIKRHGQKTFEYTLNVDAIHKLIKALPPKEANDTLPNLDNYLAHRERSKAEKRKVREKSRTVSEKSPTLEDSEKSHRVREKSRQRYVKNQLNIDSITEITEIESTNDKPDENDSLSHSSTPSSLIANQTTQKNVESLTTGNTPFEALEPEQKRIADYLEKLEFEFDDTDLNRGYLSKIAKKVHSLEEMTSLLAFTRMQEHLKGKTVFLGNLANTNNLNGWKQEQAPPPHKPKSSQQGKSKSLAELNAEKMQYAGITARK